MLQGDAARRRSLFPSIPVCYAGCRWPDQVTVHGGDAAEGDGGGCREKLYNGSRLSRQPPPSPRPVNIHPDEERELERFDACQCPADDGQAACRAKMRRETFGRANSLHPLPASAAATSRCRSTSRRIGRTSTISVGTCCTKARPSSPKKVAGICWSTTAASTCATTSFATFTTPGPDLPRLHDRRLRIRRRVAVRSLLGNAGADRGIRRDRARAARRRDVSQCEAASGDDR